MMKECGCSLESLGGIQRRVSFLSTLPNADYLLLDYGNYFLDQPDDQKELAYKKAKLMADLSLKYFKFNAMNFSQTEQKHVEAISSYVSMLPFVSLTSQNPSVPQFRDLTLGKTAVRITSISKGGEYPTEELKMFLSKVDSSVLPIVLSERPITENIKFLENYNGHPFLLLGNDLLNVKLLERAMGNSLYVTGTEQGRQIAELKLDLKYRGSKLVSVSSLASKLIKMNIPLDKQEIAIKVIKDISDWEKINGEFSDGHY
jgi:hypothetical protein